MRGSPASHQRSRNFACCAQPWTVVELRGISVELRGAICLKLPWLRRWRMAKCVGIAGPLSRGSSRVAEGTTRVPAARGTMNRVVELHRIVVELCGAICLKLPRMSHWRLVKRVAIVGSSSLTGRDDAKNCKRKALDGCGAARDLVVVLQCHC